MNEQDDVELCIIGAGVVGLACAELLAERGMSVVVLERHALIGQETSSRNSGVIHAGLYYPDASLKARLCVEGRQALYARAARDGIAHRRCEKLIVATRVDDVPKLEALAAQGACNGAGALRMLDARELAQLEPNVQAVAALWSPETGIVDVHALMSSQRARALAHGAVFVMSAELIAIERINDGYRLQVARGAERAREAISARRIVNAAGLSASHIASLAGLDVAALGYRQQPCKGDYFRLASRLRGLVTRLIYPVPESAGLGIHVTLDLAGELRAGPDAQYVETLDYAIDPDKRARFGQALRRYLPAVRDDDLTADYAGIRPKLQGPGQAFADFVIEDARAHGLPGFINLLGIESPGLTASAAIARQVVELLPN